MKFSQQFITDTEYIETFESSQNLTLPDEYRQFLIGFKGGVPIKNNYYKKLDTGGIYDFEVSVFFGKNTDNLSFDLSHNYIMMLGIISKELLCIANDGVGNYLCVGTEGDYLNKIFISWESEDGLTYSNTLIESSLVDLLNRLK